MFLFFALLFACSKESNDAFSINPQDLVYICKGAYSKSYHYDENCDGLRKCTTEIFEITTASAQKKGRTLCGYEMNPQNEN